MTAVPSAAPTEPGRLRSAGPRQLIVTVYGLYSRDAGGWMSVASLVRLLADAGVDEPAVRSSISRLKRREILHASRRGGAAGYELSRAALAILDEGDRRIFRRERGRLADGWLLAVFSVPESERRKRHLLRSQLSRLGFGTAAPGVWIAPAHLEDSAAGALRRLGLSGYADLFRADHLAFGDLPAKVRQWWDLGQIEGLYREFVTLHQPVLRSWRDRLAPGARSPAPAARAKAAPGAGRSAAADDSAPALRRAAFADYVRVLTDWRRLPYLDPGLPAEVLPPDWIGITAADAFFSLRERLDDPARAHAASVTGSAAISSRR